MLTTRIDEQVTPNSAPATGIPHMEVGLIERPALRDQVNSIIHDGLTDMWLLLTGEEIDVFDSDLAWRDGRPMAVCWSGQVEMLTSKLSALETLRVLGIEML